MASGREAEIEWRALLPPAAPPPPPTTPRGLIACSRVIPRLASLATRN